ncbi:DUF4870 domain-containing protein [Paenibacillus glucanolyticus]|jgi:hypothetical protein|uniref:DUF4870 domain-containing protein n=2 Tax=Paenibacillus TaxID=44249 RepID=A0A163KQI5_9BACL|nr:MULTISPECIES: DUF4870 domain-containing protein [Paenibacillus]ANA81387.1 hypothetical protein A3958_16010 [Paenibacillus glucanolyticus]AVV59882.1 DUF4870 domain-containing protein [Paenibacillus glucanolyticus]AWP29139.1 hypothetical protein B9D94_22090 [Paenibacillus sp. Cedars]ETT35624.1 hypothetical protein C169_16489 [Paenibacillus sp. FSL R5-808]KZS47435.1 hypothetical protein AWU65_16610 [Paenibacillus glucanolyticus]
MRQLLSSLSYFSIFFAPFLLPLIVWILSPDAYVAKHARRALFSHVFPVIAAIPMIYMAVTSGSFGSIIGYLILFGIIYFGAFVYNIIMGIQVLRETAY